MPEPHPSFEEDLPGGAMWSHVVKRHHTLRVVDVEGGANVGMLLYNAQLPTERYNMPDTLKAQHTAFITRGRVLMSDMGRALMSVTADTCGWHDTLAGHLDAAATEAKYGRATYQEHRNAYHRDARGCFLVELQKWGLGKPDLAPNLNLFSKVVADEAGALRFVPGASRAGAAIELRAELDVLVVLNTCQHPLDPASAYAPRPVKLQVFRTPAPGPDDACRTSRPEAGRAIGNSERFFL